MDNIFINPNTPIFQPGGAVNASAYADILNYVKENTKKETLENVKSVTQTLQEQSQEKAQLGLTQQTAAALAQAQATQTPATVLGTVMQSELTGLLQLVAQLQQANPQLAKQLSTLLSRLKEIENKMPNLTEADKSDLVSALNTCNQYLKQLPLNLQAKLMLLQNKMFIKMAEEMKGASTTLKTNEKTLQSQSEELENLEKLLQQIRSLLPQPGQPLDPKQVPQILAALTSLLKEKDKLSDSTEEKIEQVIRALSEIKKGKKKDTGELSQALSQALEGVDGDVKDQLAAIKDALQKGQLAMDALSSPASSTTGAGAGYGAEGPEGGGGYGAAAPGGGGTGGASGKGGAGGAAKADDDPYANDSLEHAFADAIFGHFMPAQNEQMANYVMLLTFFNLGASFGNTLLSTITNFSSAQANYNFGSSCHLDTSVNPPAYSGNANDIAAQLKTELETARNDLASLQKLAAQIQDEIKKLQTGQAGLTPGTDASQMIKDLKSKLLDINAATFSQQNLIRTLGALKIVPGADNKHFTVEQNPDSAYKIPGDFATNWATQLHTGENDVINGVTMDPADGGPSVTYGGLRRIDTQIEDFQSNYSDHSSTQQEMLQMLIIQMQQSYSTISSLLQTLNQIFMSVIQAINKS